MNCVSKFFISLNLAISFSASSHGKLLYCASTRIILAPPTEPDTRSNRFYKRDAHLFFAETLIERFHDLSLNDSTSEIDLGCLSNQRATLIEAMQSAAQNPGTLDLWQMRKFLGQDYLHSRVNRHRGFLVPDTLQVFEEQTSFKKWAGALVKNSRVKRLTRKIYHSPAGYSPKISVAQTHQTQDDNLSHPVRETELLIERSPNSNQWDFYAYNEQGILVPESEFGNGSMQASPATCLACHYDPELRKFVPLSRPND